MREWGHSTLQDIIKERQSWKWNTKIAIQRVPKSEDPYAEFKRKKVEGEGGKFSEQ